MIVYQHRRLDTKEIFYIGIGDIIRAYTKSSRNKYWKNITSKVKYSVEILHDNLSLNEACITEKLLISHYGRKDLGLGLLVNMTDGGEGVLNLSIETKIKISNALKGNTHFSGHTHSEENKKKLSILHTGKKLSEETKLKISIAKKGNLCSSKKVINTETGEIFDNAKIVSKKYNIVYCTLTSFLNGNIKTNKTKFKYLEDYDKYRI